jgi:dolichol-phosphate mannosyltransferase
VPASVWVVLPTYDEAATLEPLVHAVVAALPGVRVLVVDDGSPDGTGEIADALAVAREDVEVIHQPRKAGIGRAYVAGFRHALNAGAGAVFEMDADGSHDPADLPRLLDRVAGGADVALGSRYVPGGGLIDWGPTRRRISRMGCAYARRMLGVDVRDLTSGLKCFRATALEAIDYASVRSQGYAFQVELTYRALRRGLQVEEVPIVFRAREHGRSKMSWAIAAEAAWVVPALRFGRRRWNDSGEPARLPII